LLTPQPTPSMMDTEGAFTNFTSGPASITKGADGIQNYAYTGATNSSGLGKTIPVAYGKVLAGSLLIGAQINTKTTQTSTEFFRQPGVDTFTLNGDPLTFGFSDAGGIRARLRKKGATIKKNNGRKYTKNKDLNFTDGEQTLTSSTLGGTITGEKSGKTNTKRFSIIFDISGLLDRVGDNDTAFIDGFITYRVIVKESDSNDIVGQHQMTIQGLFKKNERVRYQVMTPYSKLGDKDNYKVFIQIIDSSILKKDCTFTVKTIGYGLF